MKTNTLLWILVLFLLLMYILTQILNFYGVDASYYGTYFAFYLFLLLTMLVLPQRISQNP